MQAHHSGESGDHETPCPRKRAARREVHPTRPAAAAKTEQEVGRGPLHGVVVHERAPSLELLAREEKTRRVKITKLQNYGWETSNSIKLKLK